jgi:hypothetical protein
MILSICFDAMSWRHCVACDLLRDSWFIDMFLLSIFSQRGC